MSASSVEALLKAEDIAKVLDITDEQVRILRRRGEISGINVGTVRRPIWRYDPAELRRFIAARTSKAA